MKAEILPLDGKYYGTVVNIIDDYGNEFDIKIWNNANCIPSHRELDGLCTPDEWKENVFLCDAVDGWTGKNGMYAKDAYEVCDSHFESAESYALAKKIVDLINEA